MLSVAVVARAIILHRTGNFDPSTYYNGYQEALQQLIEAKIKVLTIKPRVMSTPPPVIHLMAALNAVWRGNHLRGAGGGQNESR